MAGDGLRLPVQRQPGPPIRRKLDVFDAAARVVRQRSQQARVTHWIFVECPAQAIDAGCDFRLQVFQHRFVFAQNGATLLQGHETLQGGGDS